jgi:hypothetical protein
MRSYRAIATIAALSTAALVVHAATARADRRAFGHVYEYQTMPQGGLDLEIWNTQTRPDLGQDPTAFELQLETEYGITDHWDIALYQNFSQGAEIGASFQYASTAVETRYRFADRGELPVDVLGYFEIKKPLAGGDLELEWKAILARDLGPVTVAANLIAELEIEDGEAEFIPGWALGVSYEAVPALKLGVETFGAFEPEDAADGTESRVVEAWLGPAVSWAPSPKLWILASGAFGLTEHSDDFIARLIVGISL